MNPSALPGHLLLQELTRHWRSRRAAQDLSPTPRRTFTIALAREAGTPGTAVAHEVGKRLGWHVYDHELLEHLAQDLGIRANLLESVDERHKSWFQEAMENFIDVATVSEGTYTRHLVETILGLGALGECVIVGRGAAFILPAEATLRVRLIAPAAERVAVIRRQFNLTQRAAEREMRRIDRERSRFVRDHFLRDPADPRHYDLLLNAARLSVAGCAACVIEALRQAQTSAVSGRTEQPVADVALT